MSNAGTAFSFKELFDAASLPIAWTSRRPRIKIGLPATAQARFLPVANHSFLPLPFVYVLQYTERNGKERAGKFTRKNL